MWIHSGDRLLFFKLAGLSNWSNYDEYVAGCLAVHEVYLNTEFRSMVHFNRSYPVNQVIVTNITPHTK